MVLRGGGGTDEQFAPRRTLATSGGIFACHNWRVVLPASSGLRPGKLLHILGCKGQLPMTKNDLTPHVYRTEIEKPWSRGAGSRDHSGKASWGRWQGS